MGTCIFQTLAINHQYFDFRNLFTALLNDLGCGIVG
uniref:Uncharacterized protein n=1 Tax=Arundo donax TaxID=35708 RepID=A0A0A9GLS1_ARUDO